MKRLIMIITALVMAVLIAATLPAQVFADSLPEYISEVRIGMGKKAEDAKSELDGYKILSDAKGNPIDLNQKAGGAWGSKGEKIVDYINETEKYIIPLLTTLKNRYPEYGDPAFLVKYHIISLLESIKALL